VRLLTRAIAWLPVLSLVFLTACSGGGAVGKTIKIGVDLPLSGVEGQAGRPTLNGVRFYAHQHPVLDGYNVVVTVRDDAVNGVHNPKRGAENVAALVADPLVMGIIGPLDSSVARAAIPVANKAYLAMISPSASNPCLTRDPFLPAALNPSRVAISCQAASLPAPADLRPTSTNNFFRLAATDDLQGAAAADFGYKNLHLLRVAVLSDHEVYGQALADSFRARFTKLGGLAVLYLDFAPSNTLDLSAFFKQAKADGAQAIYFGGSTANRGCAIRAQMATVFGTGAAIPYLGADGIAEDPACVRDAGSNAPGVYATVPVVDPIQDPVAKAAVDAFKIPDLRRKLLFTLGMLVAFRFIAHIPVPGADVAALQKVFETNQLAGFFDLFSGGALSSLSVAALGVYPYITAQIIMPIMKVASRILR